MIGVTKPLASLLSSDFPIIHKRIIPKNLNIQRLILLSRSGVSRFLLNAGEKIDNFEIVAELGKGREFEDGTGYSNQTENIAKTERQWH